MEEEEIRKLVETGEPFDKDIVLNNHYVGKTSIYPRKILDTLYKLYDDGEVRFFIDEAEEELYLEKLRNTPPDEFEFDDLKAAFIKNDKTYGKFTDERINEIIITEFKQADKKVLLERLLRRDVSLTFQAMMINFEYLFSSLLLRILSTAQMRATNEIRKEIGLPPLSKKKMKKFIEEPFQKSEDIILDTGRGGKRPRKGFVWKEENKSAFYEQVNNLPRINEKPMWEYALSELMEKDFDFYIEEYLRKKTPFQTVPTVLFKEAIKTWKKYKDSLEKLKPQEQPRAFEFQHAIHLLNYSEITFLTANKYFREGKFLSSHK